MLQINWRKRLNAEELLKAQFFSVCLAKMHTTEPQSIALVYQSPSADKGLC